MRSDISDFYRHSRSLFRSDSISSLESFQDSDDESDVLQIDLSPEFTDTEDEDFINIQRSFNEVLVSVAEPHSIFDTTFARAVQSINNFDNNTNILRATTSGLATAGPSTQQDVTQENDYSLGDPADIVSYLNNADNFSRNWTQTIEINRANSRRAREIRLRDRRNILVDRQDPFFFNGRFLPNIVVTPRNYRTILIQEIQRTDLVLPYAQNQLSLNRDIYQEPLRPIIEGEYLEYFDSSQIVANISEHRNQEYMSQNLSRTYEEHSLGNMAGINREHIPDNSSETDNQEQKNYNDDTGEGNGEYRRDAEENRNDDILEDISNSIPGSNDQENGMENIPSVDNQESATAYIPETNKYTYQEDIPNNMAEDISEPLDDHSENIAEDKSSENNTEITDIDKDTSETIFLIPNILMGIENKNNDYEQCQDQDPEEETKDNFENEQSKVIEDNHIMDIDKNPIGECTSVEEENNMDAAKYDIGECSNNNQEDSAEKYSNIIENTNQNKVAAEKTAANDEVEQKENTINCEKMENEEFQGQNTNVNKDNSEYLNQNEDTKVDTIGTIENTNKQNITVNMDPKVTKKNTMDINDNHIKKYNQPKAKKEYNVRNVEITNKEHNPKEIIEDNNADIPGNKIEENNRKEIIEEKDVYVDRNEIEEHNQKEIIEDNDVYIHGNEIEEHNQNKITDTSQLYMPDILTHIKHTTDKDCENTDIEEHEQNIVKEENPMNTVDMSLVDYVPNEEHRQLVVRNHILGDDISGQIIFQGNHDSHTIDMRTIPDAAVQNQYYGNAIINTLRNEETLEVLQANQQVITVDNNSINANTFENNFHEVVPVPIENASSTVNENIAANIYAVQQHFLQHQENIIGRNTYDNFNIVDDNTGRRMNEIRTVEEFGLEEQTNGEDINEIDIDDDVERSVGGETNDFENEDGESIIDDTNDLERSEFEDISDEINVAPTDTREETRDGDSYDSSDSEDSSDDDNAYGGQSSALSNRFSSSAPLVEQERSQSSVQESSSTEEREEDELGSGSVWSQETGDNYPEQSDEDDLLPSPFQLTDGQARTWDEAARLPVLPVMCTHILADLHKRRFGSGSRGKCIRHLGNWYTPNEFQNLCRGVPGDWRRTVTFGHRTLQGMMDEGYLVPHRLDCVCIVCRDAIAPTRYYRPGKRHCRMPAAELRRVKRYRTTASATVTSSNAGANHPEVTRWRPASSSGRDHPIQDVTLRPGPSRSPPMLGHRRPRNAVNTLAGNERGNAAVVSRSNFGDYSDTVDDAVVPVVDNAVAGTSGINSRATSSATSVIMNGQGQQQPRPEPSVIPLYVVAGQESGQCLCCKHVTSNVCGMCRRAPYCSDYCQQKDWELHEHFCNHFIEEEADPALPEDDSE